MLSCESLNHEYLSGGKRLTVLKDITFQVEAGGFLAVVGPSGSGKTTLLGLLAGLDRPTAGRVVLDGVDLGTLDEDARARFRRKRVGFVFQSFQLIPTLTARENMQVPLELAGAADAGSRADELLDRVGLAERSHHYPSQLSGGEQQRVAVARAFSTRPSILFADEPTGNLDAANGAIVIETMTALNVEYGTTLVLVTHEPDLAALARRTIRLADGAIVSDTATVTSAGFVIRMAWRQAHAARRRLALLTASVVAGVGALVAVNSFTANLTVAVAEQAQDLLGADLSLTSRSPADGIKLARRLLDSLRSVGGAGGPRRHIGEFRRDGIPAEPRRCPAGAAAHRRPRLAVLRRDHDVARRHLVGPAGRRHHRRSVAADGHRREGG